MMETLIGETDLRFLDKKHRIAASKAINLDFIEFVVRRANIFCFDLLNCACS